MERRKKGRRKGEGRKSFCREYLFQECHYLGFGDEGGTTKRGGRRGAVSKCFLVFLFHFICQFNHVGFAQERGGGSGEKGKEKQGECQLFF